MKVFVGLSGGVDSAVSAALLKSQGCDVTGVFIKIWQPEFIECTWKEDRLDAMRVAAALEVPFREIDLSKEYKNEVVADMLAKYAQGVTPNPDVLCNSHIKFGAFLRWARAEGAERIATGHYARVKKEGDTYQLLRGKDPNKDQSYFLWELGQEALQHVIFPVGEYSKTEIRALAKRFDLPNAERLDSQGLCFVGDVSVDEFLQRFLPTQEGNVVNREGRVIGKHRGAILYTIGQRHGFETAGEQVPHYVVSLNVERNELVVSPKKEDAAQLQFSVQSIQWILPRTLPLTCEVQVRYRDQARQCTLKVENNRVVAAFAESVIASRGQSLVVYEEEVCLGGGIIVA